jgi:hypothetical protein
MARQKKKNDGKEKRWLTKTMLITTAYHMQKLILVSLEKEEETMNEIITNRKRE